MTDTTNHHDPLEDLPSFGIDLTGLRRDPKDVNDRKAWDEYQRTVENYEPPSEE